MLEWAYQAAHDLRASLSGSQGLRIDCAAQGTLLQLVYDVSGIFVFSGKFLPAAVGVDCLEVPKLPASTECSTVKGALAQLAAMSF